MIINYIVFKNALKKRMAFYVQLLFRLMSSNNIIALTYPK